MKGDNFKQTKNLKRLKKSTEGITLIALVITIIVLLILAGVSIATLTGQNGIITQATDAEENTKKETAREKVAVEVLGSYGRDGKLDYGLLEDNLNNIEGIQGVPSQIEEGDFPIDVIVDGYTVTIKSNGEVTVGDKSDNPIQTTITLEQAKDNDMLVKTDNSTIAIGNDTVALPGGFKVAQDSGNTVDEGIVIQDINENQFVWVPVSDINDMAQCSTAGGDCNLQLENGQIVCKEHNDNTKIVGKLYATSTGNNFNADTPNIIYEEDSGLGEPDVVSDYDASYLGVITRILTGEENTNKYASMAEFKNTMQEDYNEMIKSVERYKGFYVSRYEMSKSATSNTAASVARVTPLVNDSNNMWYGLYAYGKTYNTDSVESSMIWGSQYDAMMIWMQSGENGVDVTEAGGIGNSRNTGTTTGTSGTDVIKNVYDLYGCHFEWTLEASNINDTKGRIRRGGYRSSSYSLSVRDRAIPNGSSTNYSSRFTLYMK